MATPRRESRISTDSDTLALLGKKQVLKRRFGFWSLLAFAVCELITWETVLALFSQGFENGGPAGLIYGFMIAWSSTFSVYVVIAELASAYPIASGQYFWVYVLGPRKYKKVLSYVVGWLTSLAWIATIATECLFAGTIIQGILVLNYPTYEPKLWQGALLTWVVILTNVLINIFIPGFLPRIEIGIMGLHLAGFVAILVTLLTTADIGTARSVWLTALNEGGWPTQGLSYCVGFLGNVATFVGADASVHMAEEVENAAVTLPKAILTAMIVNGALGFAMMITVLYCVGDVESVLGTKTGFPFLQIFLNSVKSSAGAIVMGVVVLILTWACSLGITTTASRMTWSFARDKGTPFSSFYARVTKHTRVPAVAVCTVAIIALLLTCIYIGSTTAFNDVVSLTITGFYGSYLLPCGLLLYHRIKGNVLPHHTLAGDVDSPQIPAAVDNIDSPSAHGVDRANGEKADLDVTAPITNDPTKVTASNFRLVWGPWHVPGLLGIINNAYACVYMVFVIFWSVWPPSYKPTANTMNYSVVVTGGVLILSTYLSQTLMLVNLDPAFIYQMLTLFLQVRFGTL